MMFVPWPERIWWLIETTSLIGIAKPSPAVEDWKLKLDEAAVSMPTTLPCATSGPPESPGSSEPLIWMTSLSRSVLPAS